MNRYKPAVEEDKSEISLTPMLDVVFILLIFFVVTATFISEFGLPVVAPPTVTLPSEAESITVRVEEGSFFSVNGRAMARTSLAPYIRSMRAEFPEADFAVLVAENSLVADTVSAVDAGRRAGFGRVPISLIE